MAFQGPPQGGQGPLSIRGTRESGLDVRTANVTAVVAVSNVVKSSLGPVGLDKMLVDDIGDVCITNDGATILKMLEVEHPAAKILVELANLQDQEVGDGTTSVVLVAAELLKRAHDLVKNKIHPTSIISGYRIAMKEAIKFVESNMAISTDTLGQDILLQCAKTTMSSKIIGAQEDYFAKMAVDAVQAVKTITDIGDVRYPVKAINVLKAHGRSLMESQLIKGYALNMGRAAQGMPTSVRNAKIACVDFNLQKHRMHMGIQVQVSDPKALGKIRDEEMEIIARRIRTMIDAGANVVLTTKGIDDFCLKLFVEAGCIACRRVPKDDMKRIARATGATIVTSLATEEGGEAFDSSLLGACETVFEDRISDDDMMFIQGCASATAVTVLLRGANDYMLDEVDRALHDALCIVKRVLENRSVVPGGGAVEAGLSIYLENFASALGSREQLAINEFAEALLVIPKTLAVNAAKDATDLVAKLRALHNIAQKQEEKKYLSSWGLDLIAGAPCNSTKNGVLEPTINKVKLIQFATEAALTILRIDDMIKVEPDPAEEEQ